MKYIGYYLVLIVMQAQGVFAQENDAYRWYDPLASVERFEGQGWNGMGYRRLPNKAKNVVRDAVWSLSQHTAGVGLRFETDADSITVQYGVDGHLNMHHMPTTGVSGIDLYVNKEKEWLWCKGDYTFEDTIRYDFVMDNPKMSLSTYQLYFPLYNNLKNLTIGIPKGKTLRLLKPTDGRPIVVYGTSIAQGGCASRPGLAWTNILSRTLGNPVINLGFSGNGRLEPEIIDLLVEVKASVYVLDCLPNLSPNTENAKKEVQDRIRNSVLKLKAGRPEAPILLVQHGGYSDGQVNSDRKSVYRVLNKWLEESYRNLKAEGITGIHMLTKKEIGLSNDAFVDGTHPTDLGMQQYATAYAKKIKTIKDGW